MKRLIYTFFFLSVAAQSCKPDSKTTLQNIDDYVESIKSNNTLQVSITEGLVTQDDSLSFGLGGWEYYEHFDSKKNQLFRIEYIGGGETTIFENYYFENNQLVFAESVSEDNYGKTNFFKLYLNRGKVIHEIKSPHTSSEEILNQSDKYLMEFIKKINASTQHAL